MRDGLYRATTRYLCAGFIVQHGTITRCAPILFNKIGYWTTIAEYLGDKVDTIEQIDQNAVTVMNITSIDPVMLAKWAAQHLTDVRIPVPGPNRSVSTIAPEVASLLAILSNKLGLATELHGMATGSLANHRVAKRMYKSDDTENAITSITAVQEILYRAIQTITAMIDSCKALNITSNQQSRMDR